MGKAGISDRGAGAETVTQVKYTPNMALFCLESCLNCKELSQTFFNTLLMVIL